MTELPGALLAAVAAVADAAKTDPEVRRALAVPRVAVRDSSAIDRHADTWARHAMRAIELDDIAAKWRDKGKHRHADAASEKAKVKRNAARLHMLAIAQHVTEEEAAMADRLRAMVEG